MCSDHSQDIDISHHVNEKTFKALYKLHILITARNLGWTATLKEEEIILTKKNNKQNDIDRDTTTLMKLLTHV